MSTGVIAAGCTFPAGPTLALADIAIRTNLSLVHKHPFFFDRSGKPIKASYFPQSELFYDVTRWQVLVDNALQDALQHVRAYRSLPARLWLVLPPSERNGIAGLLDAELKSSLSTSLPNVAEITVLRGSHAEAGNALLQVREKQQSDRTLTLDIVVAVDSWLAPASLVWLEEQHLLHGSHIKQNNKTHPNPYGRIPGEGAAVLILAPTDNVPVWCGLQGIATGLEDVLLNDDKPCLAQGLSQAARMAITEAGNPVITHIVTDMNGEPYRADEYGFTVSRLQNVTRENVQRIAPVLASGDIGCASLVMHLAQVAWRLMQSSAQEEDTTVLVLSSSDDAQRSAVVLKPVSQGG